jgi:hypothetical protein
MPFAKLQFRPGINREVTPYTNEGGWIDGDKIRFRAGFPETVGGWTARPQSTFAGVCRALINWNTLDGTSLLGVGTNIKYYVDRAGTMLDITPLRLTTAPGAVTFSAVDGQTGIVVAHVGHGAREGDYVTFSGALSLGGAIDASVLNAEFKINQILGPNSYQIVTGVPATVLDIGNGGASTVGAYQITTGLAQSASGNGWGAGGWGAGGWGQPADTSVPGEQLRLWSHTTYGQNLIINPRGGGLYYWDVSLGFAGNRAADIATLPGAEEVPTECNIVRLSEQDRHVLAFGCTPLFGGALDPLLIRFSSQENLLSWRPRPTNTAGDLRISSGNRIVAVGQTSQQMLVLTDTSAHVVQFVGPPFTFGMREVATGISTIGPNCTVAANGVIYWMGLGEFYQYDGTVRQIPCPVREYVFDLTLRASRGAQVFAGHNSAFSEVWWFYPCDTSGECTRYVVYNYETQIWYYGTLARTAWLDRGVALNPVAAATDGRLYDHESGLNDGSQSPPAPIGAFIQSSAVALGEGDRYMFASRVLPDVTFRTSTGTPAVTMTLQAQNFPGDAAFGPQIGSVSRQTALSLDRFTPQYFVRLRGRAMALRVESNQIDTAWRLGSPRVDIRTDGRK